MPPELIRRHGVHVIPLYVRFGGEVFRDRVDVDAATFHERLQSAPTFPTTSQPSVRDFLRLYANLSQGADDIVSIHISSGISRTVASALAARQTLSAKMGHPPEIYVIDSRTTACGLALLVTAAARAIAAGLPADRVAREVEVLSRRLSTYFVVDVLDYLHEAGSIGSLATFVESVLQLKPILYLRDGQIAVRERVRTTRRAKQRLLGVVAERARGRPIHAAIAHAQAAGEAERVRQHLSDNFDCRELFVVELSPVIATHVGPGTVGVSFYTIKEKVQHRAIGRSVNRRARRLRRLSPLGAGNAIQQQINHRVEQFREGGGAVARVVYHHLLEEQGADHAAEIEGIQTSTDLASGLGLAYLLGQQVAQYVPWMDISVAHCGREEPLCQDRIGQRVLGYQAQCQFEARDGAGRGALLGRECLLQSLQPPLGQGRQDRLLGLEVVEKGTLGDVSRFGDFLDSGCVVPIFAEQPQRGLHQSPASLPFLALAS